MTWSKTDRLAGAILLLVAVVWIAGVYWTVPDAAGEAGRVGPRGFPLAMGVLLAVLSVLMIAGSFAATEPGADGNDAARFGRIETWALAATFGFLGCYVALMAWFGFVVGTAVSCAAFLVFVLNKRSPRLIFGMSLGLAFGIWLILGKAMGVYLPHGMIVDWF
ncbi:MAG: tripartite tricarboxylate transporter TctB family protein [Pseudolabrys sp.]